MSVETWKADFYAVEACDTDQADAVAHSLQKWQGLTTDNLSKHGVRLDDFGWVVEKGVEKATKELAVVINGSTCALCHHYLVEGGVDENYDYEESPCEMCPLYKARGNVACDKERMDEHEAPWYEFRTESKDPNPMIFWLQKAVEYQAESNAK